MVDAGDLRTDPSVASLVHRLDEITELREREKRLTPPVTSSDVFGPLTRDFRSEPRCDKLSDRRQQIVCKRILSEFRKQERIGNDIRHVERGGSEFRFEVGPKCGCEQCSFHAERTRFERALFRTRQTSDSQSVA